MFGNHPHGVDMILDDAHDTRAQQTRVHVEHVLLVGLGIHHTATSCGAMPYQSATIFHDTGGGGHGCRLTFDGRNLDVDHLAADRIDERIELGMAHHEPPLLGPALRGDEIAWQGRVM